MTFTYDEHPDKKLLVFILILDDGVLEDSDYIRIAGKLDDGFREPFSSRDNWSFSEYFRKPSSVADCIEIYVEKTRDTI